MRASTFTAATVLASLIAVPALAASVPEKPKASVAQAPAITVVAAKKSVIIDRVKASGTIEPVEQVFIQPQIEGQAIDALNVDVGAYVNAGDVVARLSPSTLLLQKSQLEASRAAAEALIAQAKAQEVEAKAAADEAVRVRDRATTLSSKGISSKSTADQASASAEGAMARVNAAEQSRKSAEAQLKVADAQLADIELKLARTDIKSPVAGRVVERNVMVGSIASAAGKPMFMLVRDGLLELRAEVAEQDMMRLVEGQKASLRIAGMAEPIEGTVRLVEPTVSPTTRLGKVRIAIENQANIRWGVFVEADIVTQSKEAIVLPMSAVGIGSSGSTVLLEKDGRVTETKVTVGIVENDMVEIVSGLAPGDVVVAKAGAFVRDGDRISPVMMNASSTVSN